MSIPKAPVPARCGHRPAGRTDTVRPAGFPPLVTKLLSLSRSSRYQIVFGNGLTGLFANRPAGRTDTVRPAGFWGIPGSFQNCILERVKKTAEVHLPLNQDIPFLLPAPPLVVDCRVSWIKRTHPAGDECFCRIRGANICAIVVSSAAAVSLSNVPMCFTNRRLSTARIWSTAAMPSFSWTCVCGRKG